MDNLQNWDEDRYPAMNSSPSSTYTVDTSIFEHLSITSASTLNTFGQTLGFPEEAKDFLQNDLENSPNALVFTAPDESAVPTRSPALLIFDGGIDLSNEGCLPEHIEDGGWGGYGDADQFDLTKEEAAIAHVLSIVCPSTDVAKICEAARDAVRSVNSGTVPTASQK